MLLQLLLGLSLGCVGVGKESPLGNLPLLLGTPLLLSGVKHVQFC